jgi:hypothetical protein
MVVADERNHPKARPLGEARGRRTDDHQGRKG